MQIVPLEGSKVYYLKFIQGLLTPCFLIKDNVLFVSTNIASLDYINKNIKTWGSLGESKEFQGKVPTKSATVFYYDKYNGNPKRINYLAHLISAASLGTLIFCNYMGDERLNPTESGEPFRQAAMIVKPIVSSIDFTKYPASKNFQMPYGDNFSFWTFENNTVHFYQKSGHLLNGSTGLMPMVAITSIIAAIAVPQLLDARRNTNQRAAIGTLRSYSTDQETYRADNSTYGTIQQLKASGKVNLTALKAGYVFSDIIKAPNEDFFAILASPNIWGTTGKCHYIVTSMGTVRVCMTKELPFDLTMEASDKTIEIINKLPEAR
jgi:type II secretory pathway pseudopilin PulG